METKYLNPFHKPEYMGSKPEYKTNEPPVYEDEEKKCKVYHRIKSKTKDANVFDIVNCEGIIIKQCCTLDYAKKILNPKCEYCLLRKKNNYCKGLEREIFDLSNCCELFMV